MIIDTHCHLDYFEENHQDEIILNAFTGGINALITISTRVSEAQKLIKIANKNDKIFYTIGNHPDNVDEEKPLDVEGLYKSYKNDKKLVAIGETGLDYYHKQDNKSRQIDEFLRHIQLAKLLNKPIVVHCRNAWDDTIDIITNAAKLGFDGSKFILHCFTGGIEEVEKLNKLNCYISISGIVTFKNAVSIQQALPHINKNRLLIETDSPFLAPQPFRGKQNQPLYVKHVLDKVCDILNYDASQQIYQNSLEVFSLKL